MSTKLQSQGVPRTTLVGAERQNSVDFRQGVLGMPLAFEQTPPAPPVPTCLRGHDTRLAHGANNIADEHLADAIEPPSRKPAAAGKKIDLNAKAISREFRAGSCHGGRSSAYLKMPL